MKRKLDYLTNVSNLLKVRKSVSKTQSLKINVEYSYLNFDQMPLEIKHLIFSYLEITDLHNLCKISRHFSMVVQCYISTKACIQTRHFHEPHSERNRIMDNNLLIKVYQNIGRLYQCIFSDYSFNVNINFLSSTLKSHVCFFCDPTTMVTTATDFISENDSEIVECDNYSICQSMTNFGYFLREFISDWNETQTRRLFQTLIQYCFRSNFWKRFTRLLFKFPGTDMEEELVVRLFLRRIFLNPGNEIDSLEHVWSSVNDESSTSSIPKFVNQDEIYQFEKAKRMSLSNLTKYPDNPPNKYTTDSNDRHNNHNTGRNLTLSWLNEIIKSYHVGHQAKILFILYGPLHKTADASQVSACFGELGSTLRLLQTEEYWSEFETISALEEMTNLPDEWLAENIACLLYTAGHLIASQYVAHKSLNGLANEVAITLTSMCLVQVKLGTNFRNVLSLVDKACSSVSSKRDRRYLLDKLAVSFQDVIVDLYETDEIDNRLEDFSTLLKAQASFVRAIFKRMYEE